MERKLAQKLNIYLEVGKRRTFAAALDWPGWCRMGRDEATAMQALMEYGRRYTLILRPARLDFQVPNEVSAFEIVERLHGNATTDFGAPDGAPAGDSQALDEAELRRLQALLQACWQAFDAAMEKSAGKTLRMGPRGGGRTQDGIVEHVRGAEMGYLAQLGGKISAPEGHSPSSEAIRQAIQQTLQASAHGEIAEYGPRGGKRWSPRFFVRREAWHVLDHVWEIEDRLIEAME